MPHTPEHQDPLTIEEAMTARSSTRARAPAEQEGDENAGLAVARPVTGEGAQQSLLGPPPAEGRVTRRSPMEALADDFTQATEGNPVFEGLDFLAEHIGPFFGAEPGGALRAPFRFLAAPLRDFASANRVLGSADEAFNTMARSLDEFPDVPKLIGRGGGDADDFFHFKVLDPEAQSRGFATGRGALRTHPETGEEVLQIQSIGKPDRLPREIPTPGHRGIIESVTDAVRQRPELRRLFSRSRQTGTRGAGELQRINDQLDRLRRAARKHRSGELDFGEGFIDEVNDKSMELLQKKQEVMKVDRPISERILQRAAREREEVGTGIMEVLGGGF